MQQHLKHVAQTDAGCNFPILIALTQGPIKDVHNALSDQHVRLHNRCCLFISSTRHSHIALLTADGQIIIRDGQSDEAKYV